MKYVRLAILLLLIPLCCVAFAALSKTTSIIVVQQWTEVSAGNLFVSELANISGSYDAFIYLEIAYTDIDVQDGVGVSIEVSYGNDDWTLLTEPFTTPLGTSETTTLNGAVTAGETEVTLLDSSKFNVNGVKWFIEDIGDPEDSEAVRTQSEGANIVDLCHDLLRNHASGSSAWEIVHEYIIPIPTAFAFVRVLIDNTDTNSDIHFTVRLSKVTSL